MGLLHFFRENLRPSRWTSTTTDDLYNRWWYYGVELIPGRFTKGIYPSEMPMLPRMLMRGCDIRGQTCLDIGSMEGLIPTLMCRRGAKRVVATDKCNHCSAKMAAIKRHYGVSYEFKEVGLLYNLYQ